MDGVLDCADIYGISSVFARAGHAQQDEDDDARHGGCRDRYAGARALLEARGPLLQRTATNMLRSHVAACAGAPQEQAAGEAGEEGRDPDRRAAKRERQQQAMMKRAKGISMR
jgi:hypothetical protein